MTDLSQAPVLEPDLPIIDPHHHLWDRPGSRYLVDELLADLNSGHNIRATVYIQCRSFYRTAGPEALRPVGEVEYVATAAAVATARTRGRINVCAAITGHADLLRAKDVDETLAALVHAGRGRLRGIRHIAAFDPANQFGSVTAEQGLLLDPIFRRGYSLLGTYGLLFEAWLYHHQLGDLVSLARYSPETTIVLNHVGGPLGAGTYEGRRDEVFSQWAESIRTLAQYPNVMVKLGGFGMPLFGFGFDTNMSKAGHEELAEAWRPYIETCIEAFGVNRCMFESNFPVDRVSTDYRTLWNAFKCVAAHYSVTEKTALFSGTAGRVYDLL